MFIHDCTDGAGIRWCGAMSFDFLFQPVDWIDDRLAELLAGAPLLVALALAFLLGLRHAADPDHLVAVTSLTARDGGDVRSAASIGAWWGVGHASTLALVGLPLIALETEMPASVERVAETSVGLIIVALALRVLWKWARGGYGSRKHFHAAATADPASGPGSHRHLSARRGGHSHLAAEPAPRSPRQAFSIGVVHGLAGTGAIVVLLIAALPGRAEAAAALAVFAPMSIVSMSGLTAAFAWLCTRRPVAPVFRRTLIPALGVFGLIFGAWYIGA
jgi:ABC-type nickel/cobalt efflux system permease component RcnA